ncbi:hypothetical protein [Lactococcus sp. KTH0-1S]|uniref:hypothetical protein n=1 Tax=Lactococcus sp. KTH0-1S TaxID=3438232 RepID=UPI00403CE312
MDKKVKTLKIYTIEGNVHSGKTTFLKGMDKEKFSAIWEIKRTEFKNFYIIQFHYIIEEIKRKWKINQGQINYLDRSYLSLISYQYFFNKFRNRIIQLFILILVKMNIIISPDNMFLFVIPYQMTLTYQEMLKEEKGTENLLVSYEYYFFIVSYFRKILEKGYSTTCQEPFRYSLEGKIRGDILNYLISNSFLKKKKEIPKICVDGPSAVGKTTFVSKQINIKKIYEEEDYLPFSVESPQTQIDFICKRIEILSSDAAVIIDTSFLSAICYLFYGNTRKVDSNLKIDWILKISKRVSPIYYVTSCLYLHDSVEGLYLKRKLDTKRNRANFEKNMEFKDDMDKFFDALDKKMGKISPIHIVDTKDLTINEKEKKGYHLDNNVLVVDILYAIYCLIKEGKI